jgi:hypothetical protein
MLQASELALGGEAETVLAVERSCTTRFAPRPAQLGLPEPMLADP